MDRQSFEITTEYVCPPSNNLQGVTKCTILLWIGRIGIDIDYLSPAAIIKRRPMPPAEDTIDIYGAIIIGWYGLVAPMADGRCLSSNPDGGRTIHLLRTEIMTRII
jgi:hypothetical protein